MDLRARATLRADLVATEEFGDHHTLFGGEQLGDSDQVLDRKALTPGAARTVHSAETREGQNHITANTSFVPQPQVQVELVVLIAQAEIEGVPIVTVDSAFRDYDVRLIEG